MAWYNALAGITDSSNRYVFSSSIRSLVLERDVLRPSLELTCWGIRSFFVAPVAHFPWSDHGRRLKKKSARETV